MRPRKNVLLYGTIERERLTALAWVLNVSVKCTRVTVADTLPERLDEDGCHCAVLVCESLKAAEQSKAFAAMAGSVPTLLVIADGPEFNGVEGWCTRRAHLARPAQVVENLRLSLARKRGPRKAVAPVLAGAERAA